MKRYDESVPAKAAIRKVPWERTAFLRVLIDSGAVIVAPDERHAHKLSGGDSSMVRIDSVRMLTRPDPARAFIGALERFMARGFDDHVMLANTGAPGSGRLAGALAFSLGVRQAVLSKGQGPGLSVRLPDNLWANPASAIVVLVDSLTRQDNSVIDAVEALRKAWQKLHDKPPFPPVHVLAGTVYSPAASQAQLADSGVALQYLFAVREVAGDTRLRLSPQQRQLVRKEFF